MHPLLENAVVSIQIGTEDYVSADPKRMSSTVRNISAGVLLLCKEVLRRLSPSGTNDVLLKEKWQAKLVGGVLTFEGQGKKTLDHFAIKKRFSDLGLKSDLKGLDDLIAIRNEVEHLYPSKTGTAIREAIVSAMPVIRSVIVLELNEEPADLLGAPTWNTFLAEASMHAKEAALCKASIVAIEWNSPGLAIAVDRFQCGKCLSSLVRQDDPTNINAADAKLKCSSCGDELDLAVTTETALKNEYAGDAYQAAKDGCQPPIEMCPECFLETFINDENRCSNPECEFTLDELNCAVCGNSIGIDDYVASEGGGLCAYHAHTAAMDD